MVHMLIITKLQQAAGGLKDSYIGLAENNAEDIYSVDAVSSATISSQAIRDAIMDALGLVIEEEIINVPSEKLSEGEYEVEIALYSDVVEHSLLENETAKANISVDEFGNMTLTTDVISGTSKEPLQILEFNGYYENNSTSDTLTSEGTKVTKEISSYSDEYMEQGTEIVTNISFPLVGDYAAIYNTNFRLYVPAMNGLNGEFSGIFFENGKFNVDCYAKIYWDSIVKISDNGYGSMGTELSEGIYRVPITMMKSTDITSVSMANGVIKDSFVSIDENGVAEISIDLQSLTVMGVTAWAKDWKIYQTESVDGELIEASETKNSDGNVVNILTMSAYLAKDKDNAEILFQSINYMVAKRLNTTLDNKFTEYKNLDNVSKEKLLENTFNSSAKIIRKIEKENKEFIEKRRESYGKHERNIAENESSASERSASGIDNKSILDGRTDSKTNRDSEVRINITETPEGTKSGDVSAVNGTGGSVADVMGSTGRSTENKHTDDRQDDERFKEDEYNRHRENDVSAESISTDRATNNERDSIGSAISSGKQLNLFEIDEEATQENLGAAFSMPQEIIDDVLCDGSSKDDSILRICIEFSKNKSIEEKAEFLKEEYGSDAKGFIINGSKIATLWDKDGIYISYGTSAKNASTFLSWENTAKRIDELLDAGMYAPTDILLRMRDYEEKYVAEIFWNLYSNLDLENYSEIKELFDDEMISGGYPKMVERTENLLKTADGIAKIQDIARRISEMYIENPNIMRYKVHQNPIKVNTFVSDLSLERKTYTSENLTYTMSDRYITDDEINRLLCSGSGISGGKERIYQFFKENYNTKDRVDFLKKEYGWGGRYDGISNENHDGKGITYSHGNITDPYVKIELSWSDVEKRIDKLILDEEYLSEAELEDAVSSITENKEIIEEQSMDITGEQTEQPFEDFFNEIHSEDNGKTVALFPVGDFYETYREDAEQVSKTLDITIAKKIIDGKDYQMCGFPKHVLEKNVNTLNDNGFDVVLVDEDRKTYKVLSTEKALGKTENINSKSQTADKHNFVITNNELSIGGAKEKFKKNMEAIRVLKECEEENRLATPEEQQILSEYVGWGGLADAFDETKTSWADEFEELYNELTPAEYEKARASTLNAHYTSPIIIKSMYKALENMGFNKGNILEIKTRYLIQRNAA